MASMIVGPGVSSSMPDQHGEEAADREEDSGGDQEHDPDPLVVDGW